MSETLTLRLRVKEALLTLYNLVSDRIELLSGEWQRRLTKLFTEILRYDEETILSSGCHRDLLEALVNLYNILLKGEYNDSDLSSIERQLSQVTERIKSRIDKRLKTKSNMNKLIATFVSILFLLALGITLAITHSNIYETIKIITVSAHSLSVLFFLGMAYQFSTSKGNITKGYIYMLLPFLVLVLFLSVIVELLFLSNMIPFSLMTLGLISQILIVCIIAIFLYRSLVAEKHGEVYVELKIPHRKKEKVNLEELMKSDEWRRLHESYSKVYGESGIEILKYEINVLRRKGLTLNEINSILRRRISYYTGARRDK